MNYPILQSILLRFPRRGGGRSARLVLEQGLTAQTDLAARIDVEHLDHDLVALLEHVGDFLDTTILELGNVTQAIETGKNLDEADKLLKELEAQGLDPSKLARIREDLNAARSGNSQGPEAKPQSRSVLNHGPEEPKIKPAKPSGGKN